MFVGSAHTLVRIYYTRRLLKWFYARKQSNEEANLKSLRAQQKLKVEELKKKTSYYTTKSILERYDPAAAEKAKKEAAQQQQQQHARTTARAAPDQQARMRLPQTNGAGTMEFFFTKKEAKERDIDVWYSCSTTTRCWIKTSIKFSGPKGSIKRLVLTTGITYKAKNRMDGLTKTLLGAQLRYPQQQQQQQPMFPPAPSVPRWYDKLVDALVGEEGAETKYALICRHCFAHNGLVLPQEIETIRKFVWIIVLPFAFPFANKRIARIHLPVMQKVQSSTQSSTHRFASGTSNVHGKATCRGPCPFTCFRHQERAVGLSRGQQDSGLLAGTGTGAVQTIRGNC